MVRTKRWEVTCLCRSVCEGGGRRESQRCARLRRDGASAEAAAPCCPAPVAQTYATISLSSLFNSNGISILSAAEMLRSTPLERANSLLPRRFRRSVICRPLSPHESKGFRAAGPAKHSPSSHEREGSHLASDESARRPARSTLSCPVLHTIAHADTL